MYQNFTIQYQKVDGTKGTYDILAEDADQARELVAKRRLPTMNDWTSWNVVIDIPTSSLPSVGLFNKPQQDIDRRSYNYYDQNAQSVTSPEFASQQEADRWALQQGYSKTAPSIGWHTVTDAQGNQVKVYGTEAQAQSTGDINYDILLNQIQSLNNQLIQSGYQVNPNIDITPENIAEFTKIAESEINPYYANQLKLARAGFLQAVGYAQYDIDIFENKMEKQYGKDVRTLGETMAQKGLAYSGQRKLSEQELAEGYEQQLSSARKTAERATSGLAQTFAQQYGTSQLPISPTNPETFAIPGEERFTSISQSPLYTLDQSVYEGLVGEQEFARRGNLGKRKAELAGLTRELGGIESVRQLLS